ncbi:hypothetical protein Pelo_4272 [Pelomyxa schiedti]|nr:hypothetical protein Pelo_4272 [Pelomyxa schiedti]
MVTATTTTRVEAMKETARDQVGAMAAGTHPRCGGAGCPLLRLLATNYGSGGGGHGHGDGDGTLVVRLVWEWLMENSRFYTVWWENDGGQMNFEGQTVMITFGVSLVLLTLTHEMRWWVQRSYVKLLFATRDYLVLRRGYVFVLQDRVTGQRVTLLDYTPQWKYNIRRGYNSKWLVMCDCDKRTMVVVEIPKKSAAAALSKNPSVVVVPLDVACKGRIRWNCQPSCKLTNEDHALLLFMDNESFFEIAVVDLRETSSSKTLVVLSSTIPRNCCNYLVLTKSSGCRALVTQQSSAIRQVTMIEERTGRLQQVQETSKNENWWVSQLNESQFCVFCYEADTYTVWDVNDTSKPVRSQKLNRGFRQPFVEGGLLFQVGESGHEILVTEESSGAHVITFQLLKPIVNFHGWASWLQR